jgi:GH15 family glucan-1,4-alpha-glucosidase
VLEGPGHNLATDGEAADRAKGAPLSVSPLTWSRATFVAAVLEYVEREVALR